MQSVPLPIFLDQLGILVTKILGDDSNSLFSTDKRQELLVLSTHIILTISIYEDDRCDAVHVQHSI
jgi:hypothetical protein